MSSGNSNRPINSNHGDAYQCRCGSVFCPRCGKSARDREGWGVIEPLLLIGGAIAVFGFWPAFVVHGQTDTGGWRWDVHTTIACGVWWGVIALFTFIIWAGHRGKKGVRR